MGPVYREREPLSCREAELILRVLEPETRLEKNETARDAIAHVMYECGICGQRGLSVIAERAMTCERAITVWAAKREPFNLKAADTFEQALALEHIWKRCNEWPCRQICAYQRNISKLAPTVEKALGQLTAFVVGLFIETGWPVGELIGNQARNAKDTLDTLVPEIGDELKYLRFLGDKILGNFRAALSELFEDDTSAVRALRKKFKEILDTIRRIEDVNEDGKNIEDKE